MFGAVGLTYFVRSIYWFEYTFLKGLMDALQTQSESIAKIAEALAKAQAEMPHARKDSVNPHFKSHYAGLPEVNEAAIPVLNKHGIAVTQPTLPIGDRVYVVTKFLHTSGEWIQGFFPIIADKPGPQAVGSGTTYARRFGLSGLAAQSAEDKDAEDAEDRDMPPKAHQSTHAPRASAPGLTPEGSGALTEKQLGLIRFRKTQKKLNDAEYHQIVKANAGVDHDYKIPFSKVNDVLGALDNVGAH